MRRGNATRLRGPHSGGGARRPVLRADRRRRRSRSSAPASPLASTTPSPRWLAWTGPGGCRAGSTWNGYLVTPVIVDADGTSLAKLVRSRRRADATAGCRRSRRSRWCATPSGARRRARRWDHPPGAAAAQHRGDAGRTGCGSATSTGRTCRRRRRSHRRSTTRTRRRRSARPA